MIEIKYRWTGAVVYRSEKAETLRAAVLEAVGSRANLAGADLAGADLAGADLAGANLADAYLARADLAGADLAGADLAGAYLADAYLADADLAGADLAGADLAGAYLAGADLARADLAGADLAGANLAGADLARADLAGAYLAGAYLAGADLAGAYLAGAYLAGADLAGADLAGAYLAGAIGLPSTTSTELAEPREPYKRCVTEQDYVERAARFRRRHPDVPVVPQLDRKILDVIDNGKGKLNMGAWHSCATTHCRAGWAITLAGEAGKKLEEEHGPYRAGRMIYLASTGRAPHFFATNDRALEDIRACAAKDEQGT